MSYVPKLDRPTTPNMVLYDEEEDGSVRARVGNTVIGDGASTASRPASSRYVCENLGPIYTTTHPIPHTQPYPHSLKPLLILS